MSDIRLFTLMVEIAAIVKTMVAHFVCVLFTGFLIYTAQPGSSLFSWHPTLMTLSFMFLAAQGFLIFSPQSSLLLMKPRKTKVTAHWVLMLLALSAAVGGFVVIFYSKWSRNKSHFASWHGLIGVITVVYMALQCIGGVNLLYPQTALRLFRLVSLKQLHATSALLLFSLAVASLVTGMLSKWFVASVTGTSWYMCAVCPMLVLTMLASQVNSAYFFT